MDAILPTTWEILSTALRLDDPEHKRLDNLLEKATAWPEETWPDLHKLAVEHNVVPLLYSKLKDRKAWLPAAALTQLHQAALAIGLRNYRLAERMVATLDYLASRGIPAMPFKGLAMAVQAYGDIALRQFLDIDILIHAKDFSIAHAALCENGWTPEYEISDERVGWLLRAGYHMRFDSQGDILEVHWAVAEHSHLFPLPAARFWQEPQQFHLLSCDLPALSVENNLLVTCIHGASNRWQKLKWIADTAYLIHSNPELDLAVSLENASRVGFRRILLTGLGLANRVCGASLPGCIEDDLERELQVQNHTKAILEDVQAGFGNSPTLSNNRFFLAARERWPDRLYYIFNQVFIPKQADWQDSPWPNSWYPLYFISRPLRVAGKFKDMRRIKKSPAREASDE